VHRDECLHQGCDPSCPRGLYFIISDATTGAGAIANLAISRALADDRATGFATGSEFENDFEILNLRGGRDLNAWPPGALTQGSERSGAGCRHLRFVRLTSRARRMSECERVSRRPSPFGSWPQPAAVVAQA